MKKMIFVMGLLTVLCSSYEVGEVITSEKFVTSRGEHMTIHEAKSPKVTIWWFSKDES